MHQSRLGVNSQFFGGSVSHSHFTSALTLPEWETMLTRTEMLTADLDVEYERYDVIAEYARARAATAISAASRADRGTVNVTLDTQPGMPLRLSVYQRDEAPPIRHDLPAASYQP